MWLGAGSGYLLEADEVFDHPLVEVGEHQLAISNVHREFEESAIYGEEIAQEERGEVLGDMEPD